MYERPMAGVVASMALVGVADSFEMGARTMNEREILKPKKNLTRDDLNLLNDQEQLFYKLINGRRSIAEIATQVGFPATDPYRHHIAAIVEKFKVKGWIE